MTSLRVMGLLALIFGPCACSGPDQPATVSWPDGTHAVRGDAPLLYISNNGSDTLSVVSLATRAVVGTVQVGLEIAEPEAPHHLAADPERGFMYVGISNVRPAGPHMGIHGDHGGGDADSYVTRLHIGDLSPDQSTRVDPNLGDIIRFSNTRILTTHFDLKRAMEAVSMGRPAEEGWASLTLIDGTTMYETGSVAVCTAPHGTAVTNDGRTAVVACYGDDRVAFVDVSGDEPSVLARVPVGPLATSVVPPHYGPYSISLFPDGSAAFVGDTDSNDLRVVDIASQTMRDPGVVPLTGAALFGTFSPDGQLFYVPTQVDDSLTVVNVSDLSVVETVPMDASVCTAPHVVVLDPTGSKLILVCEGDRVLPGNVVILDRETLDIEDSIDVGIYPDGIQIVEEVSW